MKILVIDDSEIHQLSAWQTLGKDHDLVVVGTHDEAISALQTYASYNRYLERYVVEKAGEELISKGLPSTREDRKQFEKENGPLSPERFREWDDIRREAAKGIYWDAVLCDLIMPVSDDEQIDKTKHVGQMAIGWALAIQAAQCGAKYVAVVTDVNHHDHPASALLDEIRGVFDLDKARALFTNRSDRVLVAGTEWRCPKCYCGKIVDHSGEVVDCWSCKGTTLAQGKDWLTVLRWVMDGKHPEHTIVPLA